MGATSAKGQRLAKEARRVAELGRGHKLGRFVPDDEDSRQAGTRFHATAKCEHCDASVQVKTHPLPNEIEIVGDALGVTCTKEW